MQAETLPRRLDYRHARAASYMMPPGRWEDDVARQLAADFLGSVRRHWSPRMHRPPVRWKRVRRPYTTHPVRPPIQLAAPWGDGPPPL